MIVAVVFGSDQGLVGPFNEVVADYAQKTLAALPGKAQVWAVGERVHPRLADAGVAPTRRFAFRFQSRPSLRSSGEILVETEAQHGQAPSPNCTSSTTARPRARLCAGRASACCRSTKLAARAGRAPHGRLDTCPEILGGSTGTLRALIREYLFISLFRACAESLASENTSRLAAMQRADKNIDELLGQLHGTFHRLRQSSIDEELFDVVAGFEALSHESRV